MKDFSFWMLDKLKQLGLSKKEAEIYMALAKQGEASANELARKTSSNRTVVYNVLQQLIEKGFVSYVKKKGKRVYLISNPKSLLASVREREKLVGEVAEEIGKLSKRRESYRNVEVYEGIEGMKSVFQEVRKARDLRVLNATGLIFEHLKWSAEHIVKEMTSKKSLNVIANYSMKKTPLGKFKMKVKYLPKKTENYATTFIFENKVVIQSLKDKPFLIKIENKEIYEVFRKDFDLLGEKM